MARRRPPIDGVVYSTEHGRMCPRCARPVAGCRCAATPPAPPSGDGVVRVRRETKGRKGKGVTVVTGIPLVGAELAALLQRLKKRCATGGTLKDGRVEIQGDHRDRLVEELTREGFVVKKAGG